MKHQVSERDNAVIVALEGEVDLATSPEARRVLLDAVDRKQPVMVDMSGVTYIDSSGVASLVESLQKARRTGVDLALVSVSDSALRVLRLARLDRVFSIYDSVDDGIARSG